ncbi:HU family DNA-binding protein [Thauera aromatica]|nr:HU family DNA-binding protein [Thauera aromatica]MCK2125549.1 HU family DNA-binding protein [Thauera aromatica]
MNKQELVASIAEKASLTKADAGRALDAAVATVTEALRQNDTVTLVGFGSFYLGERAARTGRNPRTGKNIKIKAAKVPKFRAGKSLKETVN